MIKIVALLKRRPDLTPAEFAEYYEKRHAPLFARVIPPEVERAIVHYVQNHAVHLGRGEPAWDCVTEIGFADEAGARIWSDWYRGPEGAVLREDEENFMDTAARVVVLADARRPVDHF
jgi:uncharacterized protein (TIGR02118 family)